MLRTSFLVVATLVASFPMFPRHAHATAACEGYENILFCGELNGGWYQPPGAELRDAFVFDVSGIPGTISSALLHLAAAPNGQSYYPNPSLSETFTLFDVTTDTVTLTIGNPGAEAFNDLGAGTPYGGVTAVNGQVGAIIDVPLNAAGVSYLNNASGEVVFGGAITTLTKGSENEYLFNSTGGTNVRELIVRVD